MARVIPNHRDAETIRRNCQETRQNAALADKLLLDAADAFLLAGLETAKRVGRLIEDSEEALGFGRARVRRESLACDAVLHAHHDALWNLIQRRTRDLAWNKMFLRGVQDVVEQTDRYKPDAMRRLAVRIETVVHKKIPRDVAKAAADEIRAAAGGLEEASRDLVPLVTTHTALQAEYYTNARFLQVQLVRLKRHWMSEGMPEQEIHEIIPDGRRKPKAKGDAPAAEVSAPNAAEVDDEVDEPVADEGEGEVAGEPTE